MGSWLAIISGCYRLLVKGYKTVDGSSCLSRVAAKALGISHTTGHTPSQVRLESRSSSMGVPDGNDVLVGPKVVIHQNDNDENSKLISTSSLMAMNTYSST